MRIRNSRGVSTIEYSLIVAVVAAAALGMQFYLKRAVSGRWRQAADTFGYGRQYDAKEPNIFSVGGIGGGGTPGVGGGTPGVGGGGTTGVGAGALIPVYHSAGGWSNLAAKGGSGAWIDPGLQSAVALLKNSSSGSYAYDLIKDKEIEVKFADLKDYKADAMFIGQKYLLATLIIENTILVDNSFKNAPAALLASLIAHEATHADYYYYPDFWLNTIYIRHPEEFTIGQIIHTGSSNSVNQEYDAFSNAMEVWKELGVCLDTNLFNWWNSYINWWNSYINGWNSYIYWWNSYSQGEEYMRAAIKAAFAANGKNLPDY